MPSPYELMSGGEALGKLRISSLPRGPTDRWRAEEDRTATFGSTLPAHACVEAGVEDSMLGHWFRGIRLGFPAVPPVVAVQDYPSAQEQPDCAVAERNWLALLGEIHWCEKDCAPRV